MICLGKSQFLSICSDSGQKSFEMVIDFLILEHIFSFCQYNQFLKFCLEFFCPLCSFSHFLIVFLCHLVHPSMFLVYIVCPQSNEICIFCSCASCFLSSISRCRPARSVGSNFPERTSILFFLILRIVSFKAFSFS